MDLPVEVLGGMLGPEVRLRWLPWLVLGGCLPGGPVVPWVGTWRYQDGGVVENTCADDLYRDPDASFVILSSSLRSSINTFITRRSGPNAITTALGRFSAGPSRRVKMQRLIGMPPSPH